MAPNFLEAHGYESYVLPVTKISSPYIDWTLCACKCYLALPFAACRCCAPAFRMSNVQGVGCRDVSVFRVSAFPTPLPNSESFNS